MDVPCFAQSLLSVYNSCVFLFDCGFSLFLNLVIDMLIIRSICSYEFFPEVFYTVYVWLGSGWRWMKQALLVQTFEISMCFCFLHVEFLQTTCQPNLKSLSVIRDIGIDSSLRYVKKSLGMPWIAAFQSLPSQDSVPMMCVHSQRGFWIVCGSLSGPLEDQACKRGTWIWIIKKHWLPAQPPLIFPLIFMSVNFSFSS